MKTKSIFIIMLLSFLFQGCSQSKPQRKDFIGFWKSEDGAIFELKEDGSYIAKQINYFNIYSEKEDENKKFDFVGNWNLEERKDSKYKLNIKSDTKHIKYNFGFTFDIMGSGNLENKLPWILYVWIGDPDEMNRYKFIKQ